MSTIYQINNRSGTVQITQNPAGQLSALQNEKYLLMRGMPKVAMNQSVEILDNSFFQLIGGELQIHARLLGGGKKTQSLSLKENQQPKLPGELWYEVAKNIEDDRDLASFASSCREFRAVVDSNQNLHLRRIGIYDKALGKANWAHLGDVGEEPPLPKNIGTILAEPCPDVLGLERFGTTIGDTHILVLIPATLNGERLTLERFKTLLDSRDGPKITDWYPSGNENNHAAASYWALISKGCIQNSKRKTYAQQKQMVAQLGDRYRLPKLIEMLFGLYLQEVAHHDNLYASDSWTRCEELSSDGRWPMACRGFGGGGGVDDHYRVYANFGVEEGVLRKSSF